MPRHIIGLISRCILSGLTLSAGLLGLVGCGSYNAPSQPPPTPTSVTISPTSAAPACRLAPERKISLLQS